MWRLIITLCTWFNSVRYYIKQSDKTVGSLQGVSKTSVFQKSQKCLVAKPVMIQLNRFEIPIESQEQCLVFLPHIIRRPAFVKKVQCLWDVAKMINVKYSTFFISFCNKEIFLKKF